MLQNLNKWIQNILIAFIMACSMTALYSSTPYSLLKFEIVHIPLMFLVMFGIALVIAEDVRDSFKKVFKFKQRENKQQIWQVGTGMIFYFAQVGFVEVFWRSLMIHELGGMPLYLVIAFMNAFLLTVVYEEIFSTVLKHDKTSNIQN